MTTSNVALAPAPLTVSGVKAVANPWFQKSSAHSHTVIFFHRTHRQKKQLNDAKIKLRFVQKVVNICGFVNLFLRRHYSASIIGE